MIRTLRIALLSLIGVLALAQQPASAAAPRVIKISHQFAAGDFRDELAHKFAQEVEKRTNGQLKFEVYPAGSLVKAMSQFSALSKGALDMTVLPLAYAGGMVPEVNITLMPALITSYEQGLRWKGAPIGKELDRILDKNGVKIVTWIWQAGGVASSGKAVVVPDDVKGLKIRGAGKDMDRMLQAAGGAITAVPSNEIYNAVQSKVLDAAATSSSSLISFRMYEVSKNVTTARKRTFWFMFEPLLISKATYDSLTPEQQKIVMDVGASLEKFGMEASKADDMRLADVFAKAGVQVHDMDDAAFAKWKKISQESAWKDFEKNVPNGKKLMEMAAAVK
jgi:TRAP-type C4-dicarboxylate transport system substrate-binding protein